MALTSATLLFTLAFVPVSAQSQWSKVQPGSPLSGRGSLVGAVSPSNIAIFVGGNQGQGDNTVPPLLTYDVVSSAAVDTADTTGWSSANACSSAVDGAGILWTFGGVDLSTGLQVNTLAQFNPATRLWSIVVPATGAVVGTSLPPASRQAMFVYLPNCRGVGLDCFLLYGGASVSGATTTRFADLWQYIPSTNVWSKPAAAQSSASGAKPPALSNAAASASPDGSAMYLFGGETPSGIVNDVYVIDPSGNFWKDPHSSEMLNLALNKPAFMSSVYQISATLPAQWCNASLATDGQISLYLQDTSLSCRVAASTATTTGNGLTTFGGEVSPWFFVDLGSVQAFDSIAVYTRSTSDMGPGRFAGLRIYFGNDNTPPDAALGRLPGNGNNQACTKMPVDLFMMSNLIDCRGSGRYVFIYLPPMATAGRYLFISELQVLQRAPWVWRRLSGVANIAVNKPVYASGTNTLTDAINSGPIENMVDGVLTNAWPYLAHTNANPSGCDNVYVAIDLGDSFDLSQVALWGRLGCCVYRSQRLELYAGSSRDWRANRRILFPAGQTFSIQASQAGYGTFYSNSCPPSLGAGAAGTSCWVSNGLTSTSVRARYVQLRKVPFNANLCSQSALAGQDDNVLNIAEMQVWAQKLVDSPAPRAGMAFTYYRGSLVIAAGSDGAGFRLNDVRFFDMVKNKWLPPVVPLGSPPSARTNAYLMALPDPSSLVIGYSVPSNKLAFVGGFDASGTAIGDVNILTLPICTPIQQPATGIPWAGIFTETCNGAGTVCSYVCAGGYTAANPGSNTVVCQPNGKWSGRVPVCVPDVSPFGPTQVAVVEARDPANASLALPGTVSVTWTAPASSGSIWPVTSYRVSSKAVDFVETFSSIGFAEPAKWSVAPVDAAVSTSFYGFAQDTGALYLDNMEGAGTNPYNGINLLRDFPSAETGLSADGDWAVESFLSTDSTTVRTMQDKSQMSLCIYDTAIYRASGLRQGACQFYAGIRRNNAQWEYGWESLLASTGGTYSPTGWNFWYKSPTPSCYVRIERNATVGTWRAAFKFQPAGPWTYLPAIPNTDTRTVNGTAKPLSTYMKLGLLARTWSGSARMIGYAKYLRVSPIGPCQDPGSTRVVSAAITNATITGLTPGRVYNFQVQSINAAGKIGAPVAPSVPQPYLSPPAVPFNWSDTLLSMYRGGQLVDALTATPFTKTAYAPSVWAADVVNFGPQLGIDGLPDNGGGNRFAQAGRLGGYWNPAGANGDRSLASSFTGTGYVGGVANAIDPLGDWWCVDMGIRTSVKALMIAGRNNGCCVGRTSGLEVYIGDTAPPYWNVTTQCDPTRMPVADLSNPVGIYDPGTNKTFPYAGVLPCSLTGRYVYLRAPPSLGVGNNLDGQYNFAELRVYASNSCPARSPSNVNAIDVNTPTQCASGKYGSVCVHSCKAGFTPVSGNSVSNCDGEAWDAPLLVCAPTCPSLAAPQLMGTCTQTFFKDSFDSPTSLQSWFSSNSRQEIGAKWFVADGAMEASTRLGCFDQMFALVGSVKVAAYQGDFSVSARIQLDGKTQGGVVFLASKDAASFVRAYIDSEFGKVVLDRSVNGVTFTLMDAPAVVLPNVWHDLKVDYNSASKSLNLTLDGTAALESSLFAPFTTGYAGVYAATSSWVDNFAFQAPCVGCTGALASEECAFTCQSGLITTGPPSRACIAAGSTASWSPPPSSAFTCQVPAPTFSASSLSVSETAPRNVPVGQALLGSTSSADFQLQWSILTETPSLPEIGPLFYVDICSGQVKLRQSGAMDWYSWTPSYVLLVRASIAGFADSFTDRNVTVLVNRVDTPPRVYATTLNVAENSPVGAAVGNAYSWDRENSTIVWSLIADGSGGAFTMDGAGMISVSAASGCTLSNSSSDCVSPDLDFERPGSNIFSLTVKATQSSMCCGTSGPLFSVATVTVQLTDSNDAPILVPGQELTIFDSAAVAGALVGTVRASDADTGAFASPTSFALLSPASQSLYKTCQPDGIALYPSKSGLSSDNQEVLVIDAATGVIRLSSSAGNIPAFNGIPPFTAFGSLVRIVYAACVNTSDGFSGWSLGLVNILVEADTANTPVIRSWIWPSILGMSCLGNENIVFEGSGFTTAIQQFSAKLVNSEGSTWRIPAARGALFAGSPATSCTRLTSTNITCIVPAGAGKDVVWTIYADGIPIASTTSLVNRYRAPKLSASWDTYANHIGTNGFYLSSVTALPVWLYYISGYVPVNPAAINASVSVTYGQNFEYTCKYTSTTTSYVGCSTSPGVGSHLPWRLTIAGQTTDWTMYNSTCDLARFYCTYEFGYVPPTITRVTPLCAPTPCVPTFNQTTLDTSGGQQLLINGTNFAESRFPIVVTFGGAAGKLASVACVRGGGLLSHTSMTCTMPAGTGIGHAMQVDVGGILLALPYKGLTGFAYLPPTILSVYGPGASGAKTEGGQSLMISGVQLGPVGGALAMAVTEGAAYGPSGDAGRYQARVCRVTSSPDSGSGGGWTMSCETNEGIGRGHSLSVTVGGQKSNVLVAVMSYGAPEIASFSDVGALASVANTRGNDPIVITGANFGPGSTNPSYLSYFAPQMRVQYGVDLENGPVNNVTFFPTSCTVTVDHKELTCITGPGAGKGLQWQITLAGLQSTVPTTAYAPPVVTSITDVNSQPVTSASPNGGLEILIIGDFYGPFLGNGLPLVQRITYGSTGGELTLPRALWNLTSQTEIRARLPAGTGQNLRIQVAVADQTSIPSTASFSYAPPRILSISPARAHTESNPKAPTMITLKTLNLPLLDPNSVLGVLFGNEPYALARSPELPIGEAAVAAATNIADGSVDIRFPLPPQGGGLSLGVRLTVTPAGASRPSYTSPVFYSDTAFLATFSYLDPVITDITVSQARFILPPIMGSSNFTEADGAVLCPFPYDTTTGAQMGVWQCKDSTVKRIEIIGTDFGLYGGVLTDPANQAPDRADSVIRTLDTLVFNGSYAGSEVWADDKLFLYSWSHAKVVAFSQLTEGTLRIGLTSEPWNFVAGDPIYGILAKQEVVQTFSSKNPEISSLTGNTAGIPTTGGDPSGLVGALGVVTLTVLNLVNVQKLSIKVGPFPVPATSILNADTGAFFSSDADLASWINTKSASAVSIRFVMPPGQGKGLPVQVKNLQTGGTELGSNTGFLMTYAPPVIMKVATVLASDGSIITGPVDASSRPLIRVPTDGSVKVRVYGTNLGVAPTVALGDGERVKGSVECSASVVAALPGIPARGYPNGHVCYEVSVPAGEGSGSLYPLEYPSGSYPLNVEAGMDADPSTAQTSEQLLGFAYDLPVVTTVTPVDASLGLPTRGKVIVQVSGYNFGVAKPGRGPTPLSIEFGVPKVGSFFACGVVVRIDHYTLNCTLPEGSGRDLSVRASVAGQTQTYGAIFSYSPPQITSMSSTEGIEVVSGLTYPRLRGNTEGTAVVTLIGVNFGAQDPVHCVFLTWSNRRNDAEESRLRRCNNGTEDFLGEGEVPGQNIQVWTHELVQFRVPEGLGKKDVVMSVRDAGLSAPTAASIPHFWYSNPRLDSVQPSTVGTDGGNLVVISGANFGPRPVEVNATGIFPVDPSAGIVAGLPTAYRAIIFHRACISDAKTIYGAAPTDALAIGGLGRVAISTCTSSRILSWSHKKIEVLSAPGIGVNRSVSVVIIDGENVDGVFVSSDPSVVSYRAPTIDFFMPNTVLVGPEEPSSMSIYGKDFGNEELAKDQGWTNDERDLYGAVGGIDCVEPKRRREDGETVISCPVPRTVLAGLRNVTIRVAGQVGFQGTFPQYRAMMIGCMAGYYGHENETCVGCPAQQFGSIGAVCLGYNSNTPDRLARHRYPKALPGWYNLNSSDMWTLKSAWKEGMLSACPEGFQGSSEDTTRDVCIVPCDPPESCVGDNHCKEGYASKIPMWRCASCDKGFYKRAGECIKCPDSPAALFIGFALLVIVVAGVGFFLNKRQVNIAVISIAVDYFQVLAIFSQSRIKWPPVIKELLHVLSAFNLNIEIVAPECLIPDVSYKAKFWFIMVLPLCVFFLLLMIFAITSAYAALVKGRPKKEWYANKATLISSSLVLIYLMYLYLTRTILDVFNCVPTTPSDGYTYLVVVFERCGVPGGTQMTLLPYAFCGLAIYTIGYPASVGWALFTFKELIMEDQLLRAKGVGNDRLTNPHAYELRKMLCRSYFAFRPDIFWWSLVIILRKFCIAVTAVVFGKNSAFQMAACLLVMFLAYAAQVHVRPFMSPSDFDTVLEKHVQASFTSNLHARLRSQLTGIETRGRKRMRRNLMDAEGNINRSAVLGAFSSWIFNYNTVESLTQFSAVIVCLMGVMYEANSVSGATSFPGSYDSVTTVLLIAIISTIFYLAVNIGMEVYVLTSANSAHSQAARAAARKSKKGGAMEPSRTPMASFNPNEAMKMDQQMNPMFLNSVRNQVASGVGGGEEGLDAVFASPLPPAPEIWASFQQSYAEKTKALATAQAQLLDLRKSQQISSSIGRGEEEEEEFVPSRRAQVARGTVTAGKSTFAPVSPRESSVDQESPIPVGRGRRA